MSITTEASEKRESPASKAIAASTTLKLLGGLVVAGFALRMLLIGQQSYWLDEGIVVNYINNNSSIADIVGGLANGEDNHPPFFFLVQLLMNELSSPTNELMHRIPSALASTLLIPATWMVATQLAPRWKVTATVLATLSPIAIWYGQEARMYAIAAAFGAWSCVAFFKATDRGTTRWWLIHGTCRVLGFYTHIYAIFLSVAELLLLHNKPKPVQKRALIALGIEFLLMAPWFVVLYSIRDNTAGFESANPVIALGYSAFVMLFGYSLGPDNRQLHESFNLSFGDAVLVVAAVLVIAAIAIAAWRSRTQFRFNSCATYLLVPVALCIAASAVATVPLNARYLLMVIAPFLCIAAVGLATLWSQRLTRPVVFVFVGLLMFSLVNHWTADRYFKEDNRSVAEYVMTNYRDEPVYVLTRTAPLNVYTNGTIPLTSLGPAPEGDSGWDALERDGMRAGQAWLVTGRDWELDSDDSHLRSLLNRSEVLEQRSFVGMTVYRVQVTEPGLPVDKPGS